MATPICDQNEPTGAQMKLVANVLLDSGVVKKADQETSGIGFPSDNAQDLENVSDPEESSHNEDSGMRVCAECGKPNGKCAGHAGFNQPLGSLKAASGLGDAPPTDEPQREYRLVEAVHADPYGTLWPIDTDMDMLKSAASIELQASQMTPTRLARAREALNERAMQFGIFEKVAAVRAHVLGILGTVKQASVTYALPDIQRFPISDAAQVRASAEYFAKVRGNYSHDLRKEAAGRILDAASAHAAEIPETLTGQLEASAGRGIGEPIKIARALAHRARLVIQKHPNEGLAMLKTAIEIARTEPGDVEQLRGLAEKSAAAMDEIDHSLGLSVRWGQDLEFPEDAAYSLTATKSASMHGRLVMVGDKTYLREDVAKLPATAFEVVSPGLTAKVASADGKGTDPDKLAKFASSSVFNRVLSGFGIKHLESRDPQPLYEMPQNDSRGLTGNISIDEDILGWERVASRFGARMTQNGSELVFPMGHPDRVVPMPKLNEAAIA